MAKFITFEGGEGSGKTTQIALLSERLKAEGHSVLVTREPGGTAQSEALRVQLLGGEYRKFGPEVETMVHYLARFHHLEAVIKPALASGTWVLCDRFSDSTLAYQGAAGGVSSALIEALERGIVGEGSPDLTLILDLPVTEGRARTTRRQGLSGEKADRYEAEVSTFHEKVRAFFLSLPALDPVRYRAVDAAQSVETVAEKVWQVVKAL